MESALHDDDDFQKKNCNFQLVKMLKPRRNSILWDYGLGGGTRLEFTPTIVQEKRWPNTHLQLFQTLEVSSNNEDTLLK